MQKHKLKDLRILREFAWFWMNMYKHHNAIRFYNFKDGAYLGTLLQDMGFEMDGGESYRKKFGVEKLPDLNTLKRQLPDMDIQLLGNLIFSHDRKRDIHEGYNWKQHKWEECPEAFDASVGIYDGFLRKITEQEAEEIIKNK